MKDFVTRLILEWVINNLDEEKAEEIADLIKSSVVPKMHEAKDKAMAWLKEQAAKSETKVDDKAVEWVEYLFDAFLPDVDKTL